MVSTLACPPVSWIDADIEPAFGWTPGAIERFERFELLIPGVASSARNALAYALAYVEHFEDDVLQLEHERAFLTTALGWAWRRDDYAAVVRLAAGLSMIAGRLNSGAEAASIVRMGIRASKYLGDTRQYSLLLNRFACLLFVQGRYRQARRLWYASLRLSERSHAALGIWKPLASFAYIVDLLLNQEEAQRFADTILHARPSDDERADAEQSAVAHFVRGFYARVVGDLGSAYEDLSACLRTLSEISCPAPSSAATNMRQLFTLVVLTELSRAQRDVSRAQTYGASAVTLAHVFGDHHTAFAVLADLKQYSGDYGQQGASLAPVAQVAAQVAERVLTQRELELLAHVAGGLSNQQIAAQLVITEGTVKKHLEHIYTKFGVSSRTAAIAKARSLALLA